MAGPFGDAVHHLASFLSIEELTAAEQAQAIGRKVAYSRYELFSAVAAEAGLPWNVRTRVALEEAKPDAKRLLKELNQLGKRFVARKDLAPVIECTEDGSVRAQPAENFQVPMVSLPLALGTPMGYSLTVGFRFSCTAGCMNEGACVSVVAAGCSGDDGLFHEISFAPSSGRCWHKYPAGGPIMSAEVMPPLEMDAESTDDVEAWVLITAEGGICFFRRTRAGDLQASGVLPRAALPKYMSEYYAAALFLPQELAVPTCASVVYRGANLPQDMSGMPQVELDAIWHLEEDEYDFAAWHAHEHAHEHTHEHTHEDESAAHRHEHTHQDESGAHAHEHRHEDEPTAQAPEHRPLDEAAVDGQMQD
mmetsp:Transcript_101832/g.218063  ORF Transcript_101832/g.218063 Transcript_101832/m.218063 type:complete len:363 (-) Transcript_101832:262-1350(-)